jgi:uncharacterized protein YggE
VLAVATAAAAAVPASAAAQAPAAPGTVSATGSATVRPTPLDRESNASIVKAVEDAQEEVLPLAVRAARERAQRLATESGLVLGALVGIADAPLSPFGPYSGYGAEGTFGPGRYCGNVGRYRTTRRDGRVRRVRVGTRRTCRVPGASAPP